MLIRLFRPLVLVLLCLFHLPLFAASHAVILQYHHVSEKTPPITSISPDLFAWHLDYLQDNGYTVWPLSQIIQYQKEGKSLPEKCVAITFDDAYHSIYTTAFPLLKARNWPFTVFINTKAVGKGKHSLSWDNIREMDVSMAEIGNHSHTHAHLIRMKQNESNEQWQARVTTEIQTAQGIIDKKLNHPAPRLFAYPYGEYSTELYKIVKKLGYVAVGQQSGPFDHSYDAVILPRFPMGGVYTSKNQLIEKLNTRPLPLVDNIVVNPEIDYKSDQAPELKLTIAPAELNKNLKSQFQCYVSGQGKAIIQWQDNTAIIQAQKPLGAGRSRYNCTAPVTVIENGKRKTAYYWYSQLWIKRLDNGRWYRE